ncbi:hypothetical protein [Sphingomonas sp.]|jgi:hypothetical protein|uniref:hypothetical protein n=1 Tax=Sphingomonas sp. TaxID=28214 RepID=UPI0035690D97
MISAFDVYLVMQLDSIVVAVAIVAFLAAIVAVVLGIVFIVSATDGYGDKSHTIVRKPLKIACAVAAVTMTVSALIPSSKTAAAMIILPALTRDEVVEPLSKEAAELYGLAKQALKNAAGVDGDGK